MFTLMEKTRTGDAIFIDLQNIDFYFLVKVLNDEPGGVSLSYGYRNIEWNDEENLESRLPPNIHEAAKEFCQEAFAYARIDNPEFIAKLNAAGLYLDSHTDENTSSIRP